MLTMQLTSSTHIVFKFIYFEREGACVHTRTSGARAERGAEPAQSLTCGPNPRTMKS